MTVQTLTDEQKLIFNTLETTNDNYFVTGNAGTGKSFLLRYFIANTKKKKAVVAPTGMAALNVQGQTIHSFFGLDIGVQDPTNTDSLYQGMTDRIEENLTSIDTLVIDEVSMVRVDVMDMIDAKLRVIRKNEKPFGGVQLICFGDLFQLPPVVGRSKQVYQYIKDVYHTIFFFGAPVFYNNPLKRLTLTKVLRQNDDKFIDILNKIRKGDNSLSVLNTINHCKKCSSETECITLTPTNRLASIINGKKMASLPNEASVTYVGEVDGKYELEDIPTEQPLVLKKGVQVMFVKNDKDKRWVNGTIGTVEELSDNMIKVCLKNEDTVSTVDVEKVTFEKYEQVYDSKSKKFEKILVGSFTQFPLKLAYAITIHKAQGKTFDSVNIDYSGMGAFDAGQTYVALSRCKSLDNLYLERPLKPSDILVNREIIDFMNGNYKMEPIQREGLPVFLKNGSLSKNPTFEWTDNNTVKVDVSRRPKKITGTRLPAILNKDKFKTPFEMWCALTHLYEAPFVGDPKYMEAGKTIEPKQYEYVKKVLAKEGRHFQSPEDIYGSDFFNKTHGDFFKFTKIFGGMWDYLLKFSDGKTENAEKPVAVFEMKTTNVKRKAEWKKQFPVNLELQGAFYAWLMGVNYYYMVASFLGDEDYINPNAYQCSEENTLVIPRKLPKNFYDQYIAPAIKWWDDYVETGISPQYDPKRDKEILDALQKIKEQEKTISKQKDTIQKQENEISGVKENLKNLTETLRGMQDDLSETRDRYNQNAKLLDALREKIISENPAKYKFFEEKLSKTFMHLDSKALQFVASGEVLHELFEKEEFEGVDYSPVVIAYGNCVEYLLRSILIKKKIPIPMINNKRSATIGSIVNNCVFARAYRNNFEEGFGILLREFNSKCRVIAAHAGTINKKTMEDARSYLFDGNGRITKGLLSYFDDLFFV